MTDDRFDPVYEQTLKPYVVLPVSAAAEMTKGRSWEPIEADIGGLEASLPQIPYIRAENWAFHYDRRIDHPERYFRQYVGVIQKGKRLIYVNAFCHETPEWRQKLVIIFDGGTCCWQAFYDPTSTRVSDLANKRRGVIVAGQTLEV